MFKDDKGEKRSGQLDPMALLRTRGDLVVKPKIIFNGPDQIKNFTGIKKQALVIRCYAGSLYELRLTLNNFKIKSGGDGPDLKVGEHEYYDMELNADYDSSDATAWGVTVLNGITAT